MKKSVALLLILAMAFSIVACSSSSTSGTSSDNTASVSTSAPVSASPNSGKKVEIVWWQTNSGPADKYQPVSEELVAKYNETNKMNTHVTIQHIGDDNYQVLLTAVAAGTAPDAAVGFSPQPMQYGLIGKGLDLTPIYKEWVSEGNPIINDIKKEYWDFYTAPDGKLYGIPYRYDPRVITYRKDMFEKAGITRMPTTWDEFIEVCRTLKKAYPDKIPFGIAGGSFMAIHACIGFGANNGTGWVDKDLKPNMTSKEWIEMLEFFGKLRTEGLISAGSASYASADLQKLYTAGECCMVYLGTPTYIKGTELEDKSGIMGPLQGPSGQKPQTYAWITGSHGLSQTKHPEETRAWLKWWSENTLDLFTRGANTSLPIRTSHQQNSLITSDRLRSEAIACVQVGCVSNAYPVPGLYLEFAQIEGEGIPGEALREVMEGATNYAEIAEKYNKKLEAVFK